ncbi:MAG: ABC transporter ATP-binding protein uup [Deltaproteobacteria bacterium ADurb.Bin510]|nr:MAG: ABC transporter ATP-binding protein uup [Deltaproteobacteria bacterium ADurb.Bin510]
MALMILNQIRMAFGGPLLLENASLSIEAGERIGLVGRNGAGKSTLMKIMAGLIKPDSGEVNCPGGARVAYLPQEVPQDISGPVYDVVAGGLAGHLDLLHEYHALTVRVGSEPELMPRLEKLHHAMEAKGVWELSLKVEAVLSRTELDGEAEFARLSAGMKRRVLLARALVSEPQLLLLDEPTNHLDLNAILWLEDFLKRSELALVLVSHDRAFLKRLVNRVVELDRGQLLSCECDYATFVERRSERLAAEAEHDYQQDRKLAQEEVWIRRGIEARRTRNEGRVRALMALREERAKRRTQAGSVRLAIQEAERSGRLVVETEDLSFGYGAKPVIAGLSTLITRGDKVGIIGPNGCGKTTLLKLLLGELEPQGGTVRLGTRLKVAYFDQLRNQLDPDKSLKYNVAGDNDKVFVGDTPRHVVGYLEDFLFTRDQVSGPARALSGGERNRLLLAKLFCSPSNVLVLDEPTNDLDSDTLELLEEKLLDYGGTVLVVSHDREFLNNVATATLAFDADGCVRDYVGGYDDWLSQRVRPEVTKAEKPVARDTRPKREKKGLSYKESRELESLPGLIEILEAEQAEIEARLSDPATHLGDAATVKDLNARLAELEVELEQAYARWDELENLAATT